MHRVRQASPSIGLEGSKRLLFPWCPLVEIQGPGEPLLLCSSSALDSPLHAAWRLLPPALRSWVSVKASRNLRSNVPPAPAGDSPLTDRHLRAVAPSFPALGTGRLSARPTLFPELLHRLSRSASTQDFPDRHTPKGLPSLPQFTTPLPFPESPAGSSP